MTEPVFEITLPGTVPALWRWLRDPDLVRRWHGWETEEPDGLDAEVRFIFVDGAEPADDERSVRLGGHVFQLDEAGPGDVVLRVTRCAPPAGQEEQWEAWYDDIDHGWRWFTEQLRYTLAFHPDDLRRTLYLSAETTATLDDLVERLGLMADAPWHRAPGQAGFVVSSWGDEGGDGLVIVSQQDKPGPAALQLNLFGLDAAAHASVADRWRRSWEAALAGG